MSESVTFQSPTSQDTFTCQLVSKHFVAGFFTDSTTGWPRAADSREVWWIQFPNCLLCCELGHLQPKEAIEHGNQIVAADDYDTNDDIRHVEARKHGYVT